MKNIFMSLLVLLGISGCGNNAELYKRINAQEAKEIIDNQSGYIILDVRTKDEFEQGHIKDAINIANETIDDKVVNKLKDMDQMILVYCRSGNRSKQAANKLAKLGYTNVYDFGGIISWKYGIVQ